MSNQHRYDYFDTFVDLIDFSCNAAKMMCAIIENYDADTLSQKTEEIHKIEHSADIKKHEMMSRLVHEFITPIEREDIVSIAETIDNVTDAIEDVILRLYILNIRKIRPEAIAFAQVISKCCDALKNTFIEFKNFKKSSAIKDTIIEVNRLEEEGDKIYLSAIRELFINSTDPVEIISWRETFDHFEICSDACEHLADIVESAIMKNT